MNTPSPTPDDQGPGWTLAGAMQSFLAMESAGGIVLVALMALALAVANSPLAPHYDQALSVHAVVGIGAARLDMSVLHWINDGLMAVFFLLVALEIKREMVEGELSSPAQVLLPAAAAIGGMAVPAAVYLGVAGGDAVAAKGWAIASATDIAFSLGVLSLLGRSIPMSLKVFLTALAIIDDLGAIVIIALFYSGELALGPLAGAGAALAILIGLNLWGVRHASPFLVVGFILWACLLGSGLHSTIGGVVLGLAIPMAGGDESPLRRLEHALHPWVVFVILPVFAFANSGIDLGGMSLASFADPIFVGVVAGLFVGKQAGVFAAAWLTIRLGLARLPEGADWRQMYGVAALTGIGFTMSLFIGSLAFPDGHAMVETRLGVIVGSLASAALGWAVLRGRVSRGGET